MVCADGLAPGARARREARALAAAGHRVTVHGALNEGEEPEEDDGDVVLVRARVARFGRPRGGLGGLLDAPGYYRRLEPLVHLAMTRDPPEALHAFGLDVAQPALAAARRSRLPFVLDDAGGGPELARPAGETEPRGPLRDALRALRARGARVERRVRRQATGAIASSDALADDVVARFGGERPVVVRECPPLRAEGPGDTIRRRLSIPPADRVVVFHGPPDDEHGVGTAIRALRVLGERVVLVVIGAAWCQDRLLRLAAAEGVLPQVRVASARDRDDLLDLLASGEAAVLPLSPGSRAMRLVLPAALLDCLMAGLPVVVPAGAEAAVVVRRAGAGIVVPAGRDVHPHDVADGVRTLLADPRVRDAASAGARRAAASELHWEKESRRLVDLYERVAADRAAAGRRPSAT